jgi:hypothetical protein
MIPSDRWERIDPDRGAVTPTRILAEDGIAAGRLDFLQRQEQRLENSIHKNLRQLERLRALGETWSDLPEGPYATPSPQPSSPDGTIMHLTPQVVYS